MRRGFRLTAIILFAGTLAVSIGDTAAKTLTGDWSKPVNGLQCRISLPKGDYHKEEPITVYVELKNGSARPIRLLDFNGNRYGPADYWRGMVLEFDHEPTPYAMALGDQFRFITIQPGKIFGFDQAYTGSVPLTAKQAGSITMIYDTKNIEGWWQKIGQDEPQPIWLGRLVSGPVTVEVHE